MSISVEDISTTKKRLKIEIPAEVVSKEYETALAAVRLRARIPGFRAGHAPLSMIEKRFGGDIRSDLIDKLVPDYYTRAMKDAALVPISMPSFEASPELQKDAPLSFTLTVEVRPKIENLVYQGLKVEDVPVSVADTEVDETLSSLREQRALYEVVDREVRPDDLLVIDYVKLDPSGENEVAAASDKIMNLGNGLAPQGILDALVGRKKGDVVPVTLPAVERGEMKEGAETGDRLRITIKEVKEKRLPTVDDDFAKDFGHDSLDALKAKIREGIVGAKQESAARQQKAKLVDVLVSSHEFDVPETMLSHELETLVTNEKTKRTTAGTTPDAGDLSAAADADLAEELRPKALRNVQASLLLDEIADREGVIVSEEELRSRIASLAKSFQATPEAVVNLFMTRDGSLDGLRHTVREEKVMDLLLAKAEIVKGA